MRKVWDRGRKLLLRSHGESGMTIGVVPSRCLETPSVLASHGSDAWGTQEVLAWYLLMVHDSEFSLAACL